MALRPAGSYKHQSWFRVFAAGVAVIACLWVSRALCEGETEPEKLQTRAAKRISPRTTGVRELPWVVPSVVPETEAEAPVPIGIRCGDSACDLSGVCCRSPEGAHCVGRKEVCPEGTLRFDCDDATDCPDGMLCCVSENDIHCAVECTGRSGLHFRQLCRIDAECKSGACVERPVGPYTFWSCR